MIALARGLMTRPRAMLLDEPSLGLSPKMVASVFQVMKEINEKQGTAIMVVEHNIKSLLNIVDRCYLLDKGKVIATGSPDDLRATGILEKIFVGALE
jgi:branched-chain amino acid transport system ATP-binding protein